MTTNRDVPASPPATGKCPTCGVAKGDSCRGTVGMPCPMSPLSPVPASPRDETCKKCGKPIADHIPVLEQTDDRSLLSLIAPIELTGLGGAAPVASGTPKCSCPQWKSAPSPTCPVHGSPAPAAPGVDWDDAFFTKPERHRYRESVWMARVEAQVRALVAAARAAQHAATRRATLEEVWARWKDAGLFGNYSGFTEWLTDKLKVSP